MQTNTSLEAHYQSHRFSPNFLDQRSKKLRKLRSVYYQKWKVRNSCWTLLVVGISLTEGRGLPQLRSMWKPFASWWLGPRTQYNTTQHNENTCSKNITLHLKSKISQQIATKQMYLLGPNNCVSLFNPKLPPPVVAPQWSSRHPKHRSNVPVTSPATLAPSPGGKNITICGWKNKNRLETSGKMIFFLWRLLCVFFVQVCSVYFLWI